jgi:hypothetical protein
MHRLPLLVITAALTSGAVLLPAVSARAGVADVWTAYSSLSACQSDLLHLNDLCYGLQNGRAIGLIDAGLTVDELDQSLGIPYDDESVLPSPEGPANPVVQVWNNTGTYVFIPPRTDDAGSAIDADGAMVRFTITTSDGTTIPFATISGLDQSVQTVQY